MTKEKVFKSAEKQTEAVHRLPIFRLDQGNNSGSVLNVSRALTLKMKYFSKTNLDDSTRALILVYLINYFTVSRYVMSPTHF
jgi:hypothetical protein